jgi:hypothetical protein
MWAIELLYDGTEARRKEYVNRFYKMGFIINNQWINFMSKLTSSIF